MTFFISHSVNNNKNIMKKKFLHYRKKNPFKKKLKNLIIEENP